MKTWTWIAGGPPGCRKGAALTLGLGIVCLVPGPPSALAADLTRLFHYQADIIAAPRNGALQAAPTDEDRQPDSGSDPLLRLVLPPGVIAKSRADLSDVRIFDPQGHEMPFVVDSGLRAGERREASESLEAKVLELRRDQYAPQGSPTLYREQYEIAVPPPPAGTLWEIVFESDRPEFIRSVRISTVGGEAQAAVVPNATIFRLLQSDLARNTVVVPAFAGDRLRLTLEGSDGFFLEPRLRLRSTTVLDSGERAVLPLAVLSQRRETGKTILEVARPDGVVPDVLRLESSTPSYYRAVEVEDVRQGGAAEVLARGTVFRVKLGQEVAQTELRLAPARGDRLRLAISDVDSPPLEDLKITAEVRQPVLYFNLPGRAGVLRFGGGRVERARYDLEQLSPTQSVSRGEIARLGALLLDRAQSRPAELRDIRPNPDFDTSPLLAFAMQPGAPVELGAFSHRRAVHVANSADGLARLRLEPEDLAIARVDLADLRIVDGEGRQWPYLLHRGAALAWVDLGVGAVEREGEVSSYALALPQAPVQVEAIELDIDQPFFSRSYRVVSGKRGSAERVVAQGKLARSGSVVAPVSIALGGDPVERLTVRVNDGDEASLPIAAARAAVPVADVYLIAPEGDYSLLLGDPESHAPRYDLADARDAVLSVSAAPATSGLLEPNPAQGWRHRWFAGAGNGALQQVAVWIVLGLAVLALAAVTLRLVRE